nr:D-alanyl-D-alanine carboxypeptidase [Pseudomonadota bacterium]
GYIRASGFNLVASARRGNTRLIGVVFGGHSATSRDNRMAQLLDESFGVARQERTSPHMAQATTAPGFPQGDSSDAAAEEGSEFVTLPAKVAAVFPSHQPAPAAPEEGISIASAAGGWGIQLGAYTDASLARRALTGVVDAMPRVLKSTDPIMEKIVTGDNVIAYRARLMGLDEAGARAACVWLTKRGQSCMPVQP